MNYIEHFVITMQVKYLVRHKALTQLVRFICFKTCIFASSFKSIFI